MKITVKPVGYLRTFLKDNMDDNMTIIELFVEQDTMSIREFLEHFNFDLKRVGFLLLNDNIVKPEDILKDGDRLIVMPMLAGG